MLYSFAAVIFFGGGEPIADWRRGNAPTERGWRVTPAMLSLEYSQRRITPQL
jgi:hypothetical protein